MKQPPRTVQLALDDLLEESPRQATSMSLPLAVHHRLEVLAKLASAVKATRAEVIGMLISDADPDSEWLEQMIVEYRKKKVRQVVPDGRGHGGSSGDNVVDLPIPQPGRPRTGRSVG